MLTIYSMIVKSQDTAVIQMRCEKENTLTIHTKENRFFVGNAHQTGRKRKRDSTVVREK